MTKALLTIVIAKLTTAHDFSVIKLEGASSAAFEAVWTVIKLCRMQTLP